MAEKLGFSAVWLRDVPFNVPSFGDAGQTYDPFVYLGLLAGQTERITLGVASVILPLRQYLKTDSQKYSSGGSRILHSDYHFPHSPFVDYWFNKVKHESFILVVFRGGG